MDAPLAIGTGLAILGSKEIIVKILGPTAEYLGGELRSYTEKGAGNLRRIFANAEKRLGERLDQPGQVPPKVLKNVITEGYFCEDELAADYFGGVLASARTEVSRDDRGASFIALIGRLTTYQIRSHYIIYHVIKDLFDGFGIDPSTRAGRFQLRTFIPLSVYAQAMAFGEKEDGPAILSHALFGLHRERLIEDDFHFGDSPFLKQHAADVARPGLIVVPSALGVELCLWAYGLGHFHISKFLAKDVQIPPYNIPIQSGSEPTDKPTYAQMKRATDRQTR